ncbi:MAG: hypothetical protein QXD55_01120 [Candidatus Aenigmatarchaeota archaeon]
MLKPIQTLEIFAKPKTPLTREVPIIEFRELTKLRDEEKILRNAEQITSLTYNHFINDKKDLTQLNNALNLNYVVFPKICEKIIERLNLIKYEVSVFKSFKESLTPYYQESEKLENGLQSVSLITNLIEKDIKSIEKSINSRVY